MSYRELMNLPIMTFWFMNAQICRIRAESDIRSLGIAGSSQSSESITEFRKNLDIEFGDIVTFDSDLIPDFGVLDVQGLADLKLMT